MATLTDLVNQIRLFVGDTDSAQFTNEQLVQYVNWGADHVASQLNLNQKLYTAAALDAADQDVGGINLPADFIKELDVRWNGSRLQRINWRDVFPATGTISTLTSSPGTPSHYTVGPFENDRRDMLFYPFQPLTQAATIRIRYVSQPVQYSSSSMGTTIVMPNLLIEPVVLYAVSVAKLAEDDPQGAAFVRADANRKIADFMASLSETDAWTNPEVGGDAPALQYHDY